MTPTTITSRGIRHRSALLLTGALTLILMAVSFVRVYLSYDFVFLSNSVLDSVIDAPLLGTRLGTQLLQFAVAQLFLYAAFGMIVYALAYATLHALRLTPQHFRACVLLWFLLLAVSAFVANAWLFPWSMLGQHFGPWIRTQVGPFVLGPTVVASILALAILTVMTSAARWMSRSTGRRAAGVALICGAALLMTGKDEHTHRPAIGSDSSTPPHVIVIGIDSLRPDFTSIEGNAEATPNISRILATAAIFRDTTTPLARTFPSWVTILTGRHPRDTGAMINLIDRSLVDASPTIAETLRKHGYATYFAIDEVRFANIDTTYGFDKVISPPAGAADFVLGAINDTPLSNLIAPTTLGARFFPHSFANRGAAHVYEPDDFLDQLDESLEFSRPTFLAVHFTLPHYPFYWSRGPLPKPNGQLRDRDKYTATVREADRQVGQLMALLKRKGALENAILVFLSDHGEGLGRDDDALIPRAMQKLENYRVPIDRSGHGTSVLSHTQYQVVLAFSRYGDTSNALSTPRILDTPASLEDVTPTIMDLLGLESRATYSGRSLKSEILDQASQEDEVRIRFTETEFNPPIVSAGVKAEAALVQQAAKFYRTDPVTGLLSVRPNKLAEALGSREFAAIGSNYVLASIPPEQAGGPRQFVVVSRNQPSPPALVNDALLKSDAEIAALWQALHKRFAPLEQETLFGGKIELSSEPLP